MTFKNFILSIGIGLLVYSCPEKHPAKHRLEVRLDTNFKSRLYPEFYLEQNGQKIETRNYADDSVTGQWLIIYDSLEEGNYDFNVETVFGDKQTDAISVTRNDAVEIKNHFVYHHRDKLDKQTLLGSEEIFVTYTSNGCFHSFTDRLVLKKSIGGYEVISTSDHDKTKNVKTTLKSSIVDSIVMIEDSILARGIRLGGCTTREDIYIKAGDEFFEYSDGDCDGKLSALFGKLQENQK